MAGSPKILIAGAGIGGLTAALALLKSGFDVEVYEQAPELAEIGAGFQMSANGTRVLYALGLGEAIEKIAWQPSGKEIRIWNTGQTWKLFDLGAESVARYGYPYMMFHRGDLHRVLVDAVRAEKADAIRLNASCVGCDQEGDRVHLRIDGASDATGDALIGADGVHSNIRQALFGKDDRTFSGLIAWRGVIEASKLPEEMARPVGVNWVGPGGHVVHYFVRFGALLNFVGILEKDDWQVESWTAEGTVEECLKDFEGWHDAIRATIQNIQTPYKWALMRREPMERWTTGRISLLGDACHPMVPMLAQGAVMAIEDGMVLARCFEAYGNDPETALQRYEIARQDRTARCIRGSNENADRFHNSQLADPEVAQKYVDTEWQPDSVRERYDWLFTYDATAVEI
jgi:salicylate hydroxylase